MNQNPPDNATAPRSVDQQACSPACPFCGAVIEYDGANFVRYECDSYRNKPTMDHSLQRSVRCTHSTDSTARLLLFRWSDWARAHGHDIGIADDTREFLRGYFALQAESQANAELTHPESKPPTPPPSERGSNGTPILKANEPSPSTDAKE